VYETAKDTLMYRTVLWTLWERERVGRFGRIIYNISIHNAEVDKRTSLVAQWIRTHLPMQRTWVQPLSGRILHRACAPQLLSPRIRACAPQERPMQGKVHASP